MHISFNVKMDLPWTNKNCACAKFAIPLGGPEEKYSGSLAFDKLKFLFLRSLES